MARTGGTSAAVPARRGRPWRAVRRRDGGAAALEFALVIPVLILLLVGIIEFGFMFQAQLALTHAAREGARMAAVGRWDATEVTNRAFPIVPAIATSPSPPSGALSGQAITITLTYDYDWRFLPVPGTILLTGEATMRRE